MLTLTEMEEGLGKLNGWSLDGQSISKDIEFGSFGDAVAFLDKMKSVVDKERHYPTIFLERTLARIILTTKGEGLSKKDFEIAEEIDKL